MHQKEERYIRIGLVVAIVGCIAAWLALPQIQSLLSVPTAILPTSTPTSTAMPAVPFPTTPPQIPNLVHEPPSVYYASFGLGFPEGAWTEGEAYGYSLRVQECERDNFKSQTISFTVSSVSVFAGGPFYLLKDGLYDHPDKNIARPAQASSSQESYAMVVFPKATAEEAQRALDSCRAFITVNSGPLVPLEPYYQGPIPGFGIAGMFSVDPTSFSTVEDFP